MFGTNNTDDTAFFGDSNSSNRRGSSSASATALSSSSLKNIAYRPIYTTPIEDNSSQQGQQALLSHNKMTFWSVFATCISCLGGLLFGYDLGVVGGMLIAPSFQTHFGIDPNNKIEEANVNGTIVSVLQIGCLFGALLAPNIADTLGRKYSIIISAFVFTIGGFVQTIGLNLTMMYIGRVISGLGVGGLSMLVPIYIAEIAHQNQRGLLGGLWMFFIATGLATSYWCNYLIRKLVPSTSDLLWRIPLALQVIPSLLLLIGMLFLFETPRWLSAHNKPLQAYHVLIKVRGTDDVEEEMKQIQNAVDQEQKQKSVSTWKAVVSVENRKRLLLGCALQSLQQLTGTNVINYFSPIVFRSIGLSSGEAELFATGVYGILKMVVVLFGFSSLIDRFGRRPLLVGGGMAMGACMYSVAVCVASTTLPVQGGGGETVGGGLTLTAGLGIAFMYSYAVFFALSWGPCPWLYCSEIYPMSTRAKSTSITTAINWSMNAFIGKVSPLMLATSTFGTYVFFGSWCIAAGVFCYFILPETKGKTLEDMNRLFHTPSSTAKK